MVVWGVELMVEGAEPGGTPVPVRWALVEWIGAFVGGSDVGAVCA